MKYKLIILISLGIFNFLNADAKNDFWNCATAQKVSFANNYDLIAMSSYKTYSDSFYKNKYGEYVSDRSSHKIILNNVRNFLQAYCNEQFNELMTTPKNVDKLNEMFDTFSRSVFIQFGVYMESLNHK